MPRKWTENQQCTNAFFGIGMRSDGWPVPMTTHPTRAGFAQAYYGNPALANEEACKHHQAVITKDHMGWPAIVFCAEPAPVPGGKRASHTRFARADGSVEGVPGGWPVAVGAHALPPWIEVYFESAAVQCGGIQV